jgi:ferric-dicitrate binding protein FerR (iron transport regulator)
MNCLIDNQTFAIKNRRIYEMKEIYKTYELTDFLEDEDFVAWVSDMTVEQIKEQPELQKSRELLNNVVEAKSVLSEIKAVEIVDDFDSTNLWKRINKSTTVDQHSVESNAKLRQTHKTEVIKMRSKSRLNWLVGLSAAASFLIGLFVLLQPDKQVDMITTSFAEVKTVVLPDGSKVSLNAKSSLTYEVDGWVDERKIKLKGEAFFEVQKGEKFEVLTPNGSIEVLGTSFNVYTRASILYVECVTGKVRVSSMDKNTVEILTPGRSIQLVNGLMTKPLFDHRSDWRSNKLSYKTASLAQIIEDIEHKFDVKITVDKQVEATNFTGDVPLDDVSTSLQSFVWPMRLKYSIKGKEVILYNE